MRVLTPLVCFLILGSVSSLPQKYCPPKCECDKKIVRCLNQGLLAVPKVAKDVLTLDVRFNRISSLPPGVFSHIAPLRSLLLNDNQLTALRTGAFRGLGSLVYLYLYRNHIRHIDEDVFDGLPHLKQLYLHVNEIKHISPATFHNLPMLDRLYLHHNLLESLPSGSFPGRRLRALRLDGNALVCDCALLWLLQLAQTGLRLDATCHAPEAVAGAALASIELKDFHCREPEIMAEPQDVIVKYGEDAMFTCMVAGEPEPEIVWLHDSAEISLQSQRYEVMGNGSLMVHGAEQADLGYFECVARNPVGRARSKPAKMMVVSNGDKPILVAVPSESKVKAGESVMFDCKAIGNPVPHLSWHFNGERLLLNERTSLKKNGSLYIENVETADAGQYTCRAENIHGEASASAKLEVLMAPVFTVTPTDQTVVFGDRIEISCKAEGIPPPEIQWYRHTSELLASDNIILRNYNQNLTIVEVSYDDSGLYHCRATNSEGFKEVTAELVVNEVAIVKPHIILKPTDTEAYRETTVQLFCEIESEPAATVEWRKDGTRFYEEDSSIRDNRIYITNIGNLIINNLTLADAGTYECSAFNEYGRDTASIFLTVKNKRIPSDEYVNMALTEAARDVDQAIARTIEHLFHNNSGNVGVHDLFKISKYPNAPARDIARAAEIYERTLSKVKTYIESGLKANATAPFDYQNLLSTKHLDVIARLSGCTAHREQKNCSDLSYHNHYRSIDGSCNNFAHPMWGSSLTGFRRILPPIYENGFSEPVGWNKDILYNNYKLPSARLVSTKIITTKEITEDVEITHMTMQWGQWLDHDLDHQLPSVSSQTWDGVDCKKTCDYAAPCFPIDVPPNDPRVTNRRCIDFVRTSSVCGSGMTSVLFGSLQPREQINQLTSFIDASQVYGFERIVAEDLRDMTPNEGLLRVGASFPGKKPLLPTIGVNGMDCRINRDVDTSNRNCFVAGDIRANEQIGLAAMHTIFVREHNRIASILKTLNPEWHGNKTYQQARSIVGAQMQFITYEQWLPLVIGPEGYEKLGKYKGYDSNLNPSISNVFSTAALRFGHSMINPVLHRYDENFEPIPQGHLQLRHAFFAPYRLIDEGGVDPLFRGMFTTPAKLKTPTQNLNSELTEQLFHTAHAVALDLAAINVQRGRDHAIPPYVKWREFCNMSSVETFDDLRGEISDAGVRAKLKELYGTPLNIDVWVGGILEDQVEGGKVGPLFRCLLLEQFQRLRAGDRFWYENPSVFTPQQLEQIKQTSFARILCDNGDNIDTVAENVFLLPELQDGLMACEDIPGIDFTPWTDCETCSNEVDDRNV
ncbi:hypothetical protein JYU34_000332 [Plutella xylostella]|uniref:Ig-like domain-containing protein n=1 Tax=Plutella xylostella TaxID=51655 RepID=A0ABQ7R7F6_PLUXY|nr:hypothetical protein JYU34_000332 [Plutella xylostella]